LLTTYNSFIFLDRDSVNLSDIQYSNEASRVHDYHANFDNCFYETQRYLEKIPKGDYFYYYFQTF